MRPTKSPAKAKIDKRRLVIFDGHGIIDRASYAFRHPPTLRTPRRGVSAVLGGGRKGVRRLAFPPGTLVMFRGHHSLHRVTPVRGPRARLVAVLSYTREPGVTFSPYARKLFYGRPETDYDAGLTSQLADEPPLA